MHLPIPGGREDLDARAMTIGAALRLLAVMVLWASCFPLITIGLDLAPHLAFAALRAALAGACLIALGFLRRRPVPVAVAPGC